MRGRSDVDQTITAWLDEAAPMHEPDGLLARVSSATAQTRHRPRWAIPERWLPMALTLTLAGRAGTIVSMVLVLLLTALVGGAVVVASQPSQPVLPPPSGLAANGLIAYDLGGDMWVMDPDGSAQRRIHAGPGIDWMPSWSPDGTRLAFWSVDPGDGSATDAAKAAKQGLASLIVTDPSGADPRTIVTGVQLRDSNANPASWSPDGSRIAIGINEGSKPTVELVRLSDGARTSLTEGETPVWSPDGRFIAFRSIAPPYALMINQPDGTGMRPLSDRDGSGIAYLAPQWSADSRSVVAMSKADGAHDSYVFPLDGSPRTLIGAPGPDEWWPSFSPDGTRIAVEHPGSCLELCFTYLIYKADGTDRVTLDGPPLEPWLPATWAPDGSRILGSRTHDAQVTLYELDPAGVEPPVEITFDGGGILPAWQRVAP
jgi:TolB protein